jgi:hypothetical protein
MTHHARRLERLETALAPADDVDEQILRVVLPLLAPWPHYQAKAKEEIKHIWKDNLAVAVPSLLLRVCQGDMEARRAIVAAVEKRIKLLEAELRCPRMPPIYMMVPFPLNRYEESYEPVALVYVAKGTNLKTAGENLYERLSDFHDKLAWFCDPDTYSRCQRLSKIPVISIDGA